ncbi:helix-turn-helix domain-containing protein [Streptomyces sp. 4N509B]|uniref:helix-turn-helix domain-containing protein n=1 Tax=Streptomyces sp. 4N509B TaxID=3457413 RepID=UPI003FD612D4
MFDTLFSSRTVPEAERFERFRDAASRCHAPMLVECEQTGVFQAELRAAVLGGVTVWPATVPSVAFRRTRRMIGLADPETYHLSLILTGGACAVRGDSRRPVGVGDFHVTSSSSVADLHVRAGRDELVRAISAEVPRASLPLAPGVSDRVVDRPLTGRDGIGALLAGFLTQLPRQTAGLRPEDGQRLGMVLVDLVASLFAHELDAVRALTPEARQRELLLRVQAFIRRNLGNPELTPSAIARAHHISVGHLHRLFRTQGETVSRWIQRHRLDGARRELADPALARLRVHDVAVRWGFSQHAVFTRAFTAAYGMSPRDFRHLRPGAPSSSPAG